ncbi:sugar fermentation stimulation protein [Achromatium sp. WMS2]|nr:sugar fermentation stimulation protein [Achromatium sp. WMS2]
MQLPPLTNGRILKRYKRFLADVVLDNGQQVTAHCPNTGSMHSCWQPGAKVQLSYSDNPKRKLAWTLERVDMGTGWIGIHTGRVNSIIWESIINGEIASLNGYKTLRQEVNIHIPPLPKSRVDLALYDGAHTDALVEIKNVTLLENKCLKFPDAITTRGRKHLELLMAAHAHGWRSVMLFALNRPEGNCFSPATDIDPIYSKLLIQAANSGVEILALRLCHDSNAITVGELVDIKL